MTQPLKPTIRNGETEMTQEILTALKAIEDKITRTPTAFNWTPAMSAIWPVDMRPTMSGLLAIWDAMHGAAVYGEAADADGWIAHDGSFRPSATEKGNSYYTKTANGEIQDPSLNHVICDSDFIWKDLDRPDYIRVVAWKPAK